MGSLFLQTFNAEVLLANIVADTLFSTKNSKYAIIPCKEIHCMTILLHIQKPTKFLNSSSQHLLVLGLNADSTLSAALVCNSFKRPAPETKCRLCNYA